VQPRAGHSVFTNRSVRFSGTQVNSVPQKSAPIGSLKKLGTKGIRFGSGTYRTVPN
jgi:hypothetical protein